ncbi:MAG: branched-chain-amino-acid transaminase [Anaerolineae bacterium]
MSESTSYIYYIDGEFVRAEDAQVPARDLALLRGYGVFDYMRTYGGKVFRLDDHIARLERSAEMVGLDMPLSHTAMCALINELLARNGRPESGVRVVLTGGTSADSVTPAEGPRLVVFAEPIHVYPASCYAEGVRVITFRDERFLPEAKTIIYAPALLALRRAKAQGALEAIHVDRRGRALEATTSNLFAFVGGALVTPGADVLPGVTRQVVLELAEGAFPVEVRDLTLDELLAADEAFITASNKEVMPVVAVDEAVIGEGTPGENTRAMMRLFRAYVAGYSTT